MRPNLPGDSADNGAKALISSLRVNILPNHPRFGSITDNNPWNQNSYTHVKIAIRRRQHRIRMLTISRATDTF